MRQPSNVYGERSELEQSGDHGPVHLLLRWRGLSFIGVKIERARAWGAEMCSSRVHVVPDLARGRCLLGVRTWRTWLGSSFRQTLVFYIWKASALVAGSLCAWQVASSLSSFNYVIKKCLILSHQKSYACTSCISVYCTLRCMWSCISTTCKQANVQRTCPWVFMMPMPLIWLIIWLLLK